MAKELDVPEGGQSFDLNFKVTDHCGAESVGTLRVIVEYVEDDTTTMWSTTTTEKKNKKKTSLESTTTSTTNLFFTVSVSINPITVYLISFNIAREA